MSKYTAEQARSSLQKMHGHPLTVAERAELFSMASNYADLLRERESAKAVVTDEIFEAFDAAQTKAMGEYEMQQYHAGKESHLVHALNFATRAALEAVAPMLASARVPEECTSEWSGGGDYDDGYHNGIINGWNGCREAMLAAAPKPEKE